MLVHEVYGLNTGSLDITMLTALDNGHNNQVPMDGNVDGQSNLVYF